jgi:cold shock CspA family protein
MAWQFEALPLHNSRCDRAFARLDVGSEVAFVEETGEKGLQASTVRLLGKHHYA